MIIIIEHKSEMLNEINTLFNFRSEAIIKPAALLEELKTKWKVESNMPIFIGVHIRIGMSSSIDDVCSRLTHQRTFSRGKHKFGGKSIAGGK